jgi:CBS domain-containing protein
MKATPRTHGHQRLAVRRFMTSGPHTIAPTRSLAAARKLMRQHRIRHLPVLEGENLLGILGIREVVRALVERLWRTQDDEARERARELLDRQSSTVS